MEDLKKIFLQFFSKVLFHYLCEKVSASSQYKVSKAEYNSTNPSIPSVIAENSSNFITIDLISEQMPWRISEHSAKRFSSVSNCIDKTVFVLDMLNFTNLGSLNGSFSKVLKFWHASEKSNIV